VLKWNDTWVNVAYSIGLFVRQSNWSHLVIGKGGKVHEFHGRLIGDHALLSGKTNSHTPNPLIRTVKLRP
jgi:hypothetical protein